MAAQKKPKIEHILLVLQNPTQTRLEIRGHVPITSQLMLRLILPHAYDPWAKRKREDITSKTVTIVITNHFLFFSMIILCFKYYLIVWPIYILYRYINDQWTVNLKKRLIRTKRRVYVFLKETSLSDRK